eukprot:evm.model.scf_1327.1 EVM.evm.TU.scf_1327.1   scf_1327:20528-34829(+)
MDAAGKPGSNRGAGPPDVDAAATVSPRPADAGLPATRPGNGACGGERAPRGDPAEGSGEEERPGIVATADGTIHVAGRTPAGAGGDKGSAGLFGLAHPGVPPTRIVEDGMAPHSATTQASPLSQQGPVQGKQIDARRPRRVSRQFWQAGDLLDQGTSTLDTANTPGLDHARLHPRFLHSNATSHKWALGALVELLDNSMDEVENGCSYVSIDKVDHPKEGPSNPMLVVEDDGGGMDPSKMRSCMSFGFSLKQGKKKIGQYGNGFKTSTMRLGADAMVITKCRSAGTCSVGLLSYTFLTQTNAQDVVVPIVDYDLRSRSRHMQSDETDWRSRLSLLLEWGPHRVEAELWNEIDALPSQGTRVCIWNLWQTSDESPELDFLSHPHDVRLPGWDEELNEAIVRKRKVDEGTRRCHAYRHSLRAYVGILYLEWPQNFRITIRGMDVEKTTIRVGMKHIVNYEYRPRQLAKEECAVPTSDGPVVVPVYIGFAVEAPDTSVSGFCVYHRNRLIKPFWKVYSSASSIGRGVLGYLQVDFVEPAHDKQDFENTPPLQKLEKYLKRQVPHYWRAKAHLIGYQQDTLGYSGRSYGGRGYAHTLAPRGATMRVTRSQGDGANATTTIATESPHQPLSQSVSPSTNPSTPVHTQSPIDSPGGRGTPEPDDSSTPNVPSADGTPAGSTGCQDASPSSPAVVKRVHASDSQVAGISSGPNPVLGNRGTTAEEGQPDVRAVLDEDMLQEAEKVKSAALRLLEAPARFLHDMQDEVDSLQQSVQDFCNKHHISDGTQSELGVLFGKSLCAILDSAKELHEMHNDQTKAMQRMISFLSSLTSHGVLSEGMPELDGVVDAPNESQLRTCKPTSQAPLPKPPPAEGQVDACPSVATAPRVPNSRAEESPTGAIVKVEPVENDSTAVAPVQRGGGARNTALGQLLSGIEPKAATPAALAVQAQGLGTNTGQPSATAPAGAQERTAPPRDVVPQATSRAPVAGMATTTPKLVASAGMPTSGHSVPAASVNSVLQGPRLGMTNMQPARAAPLTATTAQAANPAQHRGLGPTAEAPANVTQLQVGMPAQPMISKPKMAVAAQAKVSRLGRPMSGPQIGMTTHPTGEIMQLAMAPPSMGPTVPMAMGTQPSMGRPKAASTQPLMGRPQAAVTTQSIRSRPSMSVTMPSVGVSQGVVVRQIAPSVRVGTAAPTGLMPPGAGPQQMQGVSAVSTGSQGLTAAVAATPSLPQQAFGSLAIPSTAGGQQRGPGIQAVPGGAAVPSLRPSLPQQPSVSDTMGQDTTPPSLTAQDIANLLGSSAGQSINLTSANSRRAPSSRVSGQPLPGLDGATFGNIQIPVQAGQFVQQQSSGAKAAAELTPQLSASSKVQTSARNSALKVLEPTPAAPGKKYSAGMGRPRKVDTEANLAQIGRNLIAQFLKTSPAVSSLPKRPVSEPWRQLPGPKKPVSEQWRQLPVSKGQVPAAVPDATPSSSLEQFKVSQPASGPSQPTSLPTQIRAAATAHANVSVEEQQLPLNTEGGTAGPVPSPQQQAASSSDRDGPQGILPGTISDEMAVCEREAGDCLQQDAANASRVVQSGEDDAMGVGNAFTEDIGQECALSGQKRQLRESGDEDASMAQPERRGNSTAQSTSQGDGVSDPCVHEPKRCKVEAVEPTNSDTGKDAVQASEGGCVVPSGANGKPEQPRPLLPGEEGLASEAAASLLQSSGNAAEDVGLKVAGVAVAGGGETSNESSRVQNQVCCVEEDGRNALEVPVTCGKGHDTVHPKTAIVVEDSGD